MSKLEGNRNKESILSVLKQVDKSYIAKSELLVHFPTRFLEAGLANIAATTSVFGLFVIYDVKTKTSSLFNLPIFVDLVPYKHERIKIDEEEYVQLYFEPGDVVIKSNEVLVRDSVLFSLLNEFIFKAKIPYYVEYEDIVQMFNPENLLKFTKVNFSKNPEVIELLISITARSNKDLALRVRNFTTGTKPDRDDLEFIGVENVLYSMNSTVSKLAGNYFEDAIVSSLINKSTKVSNVEKILKA